MRKNRLLYYAFAVLIILGLLFSVSGSFWDMRWFDSLMHFLGGLSAGLFAVWVWYVSGLFGWDVPTKKQVFITALFWAMFVGVGWEFFEYVNGMANPIGSYALDTFNDVFADFIGGVVAGLFAGRTNFYLHE
jgi:hypothetical protein